MGQILVVASGKGGVGKSTVSCFLGCALARRGKKVLLIDCDAGLRSMDLMLGVGDEMVYDLSDVLLSNCEIVKAIYPVSAQENLFLLPAPLSVKFTYVYEDLNRLLKGLSFYYDYVLLDCPAGVGGGFFAAANCASTVLVVVTPDPVCIRDGQKVHRLLMGEGVSDVRLIVNKVDGKSMKKSGVRDLDAVIDQTGIQLIGVVPRDEALPVYTAKGTVIEAKGAPVAAFANIAARLDGESRRLMNLN